MGIRRTTWIAALQLAVVLSVLAAGAAVAASAIGEIPEAVIVLTVIVVAFIASWVRTGRVAERRNDSIVLPMRSTAPSS